MNIAVDGLIYEHSGIGGIVRTYDEILPLMCDLDPDLSITVMTNHTGMARAPRYKRLTAKKISQLDSWCRPQKIWRNISFAIRRASLSRACQEQQVIWHSTYYSRLPSAGIAWIVSVYDLIHERLPAFFQPWGRRAIVDQKRRAILEADCLLCISFTTQRDLCEHYGIDVAKTRVAHLAPSPIFQLLSRDDRPAGKPFFLFVGQRGGYKNFDGLLSAYASWPGRDDVDLVVVGPPWTREQQQRLDSLGDSGKNVMLRTNVSDKMLCRLYNDAAAFIYPSLYEGFGIPLLEAMACGCPVIASDIPSSREVADNCAHFFELGEIDSLHAAFDAVLSPARSNQLIQAGIKRAGEFTWRSTAEQTLATYREFADGGPRS